MLLATFCPKSSKDHETGKINWFKFSDNWLQCFLIIGYSVQIFWVTKVNKQGVRGNKVTLLFSLVYLVIRGQLLEFAPRGANSLKS